jgi:alkylated DNA repair dioxygenase AlkB
MKRESSAVKQLQKKAQKRKAQQKEIKNDNKEESGKKSAKNSKEKESGKNSKEKKSAKNSKGEEKTRKPTIRQKTVKISQVETKLNLKDNSIIEYYPNFLNPTEAKALYEDLLNHPHWTHGIYKMYGRDIPTPRLLSALADEDVSDSYKVTPAHPFSDLARTLKEKIEKFCNCKIRYAQMNYYRNGNDYIGFHCDSEVYQGDLIASISLGTSRRFVLRHKKWKENGTDKVEFELQGGSLILMKGDTQDHWKHCVPKQPKIEGSRINLTFRNR